MLPDSPVICVLINEPQLLTFRLVEVLDQLKNLSVLYVHIHVSQSTGKMECKHIVIGMRTALEVLKVVTGPNWGWQG